MKLAPVMKWIPVKLLLAALVLGGCSDDTKEATITVQEGAHSMLKLVSPLGRVGFAVSCNDLRVVKCCCCGRYCIGRSIGIC